MITRLLTPALLILSASPLIAQEPASHARATITVHGRSDVSTRQSLGICLDHTHVDPEGAIHGDFNARDLDLARGAGFAVRIGSDDVSAYYAERAATSPSMQRSFGDPGCPGSVAHPVPAQFTTGSMGGFLTWQVDAGPARPHGRPASHPHLPEG